MTELERLRGMLTGRQVIYATLTHESHRSTTDNEILTRSGDAWTTVVSDISTGILRDTIRTVYFFDGHDILYVGKEESWFFLVYGTETSPIRSLWVMGEDGSIMGKMIIGASNINGKHWVKWAGVQPNSPYTIGIFGDNGLMIGFATEEDYFAYRISQ